MKKRVIIIPAAILVVATPATVIAVKHLDQSSTAPVIKSSAEEWSKTATVTVATAATFGGSDLDYYEYCISDTDSIDDCEWKTSSVDTIRVRNLGTSYVWLRAVSKYGVVSDASAYVVTRVDRNKPDASSEDEVTTSSITVTVSATDDSGIKSYEYSIDDSEYVTDGNSHTFSDLTAGTTYNIKIRITDLAGNTKILNFTQSTNSIVTNSTTRRASFANFSGSFPNFDFSSGGRPSMPSGFSGKPGNRPEGGKGSSDELPDTPEGQDTELPNPDQPEQPEEPTEPSEPTEPTEPEQPTKPEQPESPCEKPAKPEKPEKPEGLEEGEEPEEPQEPEQPSIPVCPEQPEQQEQPDGQEQPSENNDSASANEEPVVNEPENNDEPDAIENSEPTATNDTILDETKPSENTSAIDF